MSALASIKPSKAAAAKAKVTRVQEQAGTLGHTIMRAPTARFRTDLVDPVLAFVVYGVPAPQGSKVYAGHRGGKPVLKEDSDGLKPWRDSVRRMAHQAIQQWTTAHGRAWAALDEPVLVSLAVTMPSTGAAVKRGDVFPTGTPDLDKLQRAIGDALAPTPLSPSEGKGMAPAMREQVRAKLMMQRRSVAVLHDDSRIVAWGDPHKVYPSKAPASLAHAGATIQVWRIEDLNAAARFPALPDRDGVLWMRAADAWEWMRPADGRTWPVVAADAWATDAAGVVAAHGGTVMLRGRAVDPAGVWVVLAAIAMGGPDTPVRVEIIAPGS